MTRARPTSVAPGADPSKDLTGPLHEVSNALTVVLGWIDVARAKLPDGPEREALEIARTHARLGYSVARQAIGAEVADSGNAQSTARAVAQAAVTGVTPEALRRGVELMLDVCEGHAIIGDPSVALQILTNLLLNAIAFTPAERRVSLSVRELSDKVVFTVRDEGPGLAPGQRELLFKGPATTRRGGAGVGLKYSHVLASEHGARLTLAPGIADGAAFDLHWPTCEAHSSTGTQRAVGRCVRGVRVLVVEDDAAVRSLIELALEARGAEAVLVSGASELELALSRGGYDVALIDLSPIGDQVPWFFRRLRDANPKIAVILISGLASGVPCGLEREVAAWVRKPFEMGEVLEAISRLLGGSSTFPSASAAG